MPIEEPAQHHKKSNKLQDFTTELFKALHANQPFRNIAITTYTAHTMDKPPGPEWAKVVSVPLDRKNQATLKEFEENIQNEIKEGLQHGDLEQRLVESNVLIRYRSLLNRIKQDLHFINGDKGPLEAGVVWALKKHYKFGDINFLKDMLEAYQKHYANQEGD